MLCKKCKNIILQIGLLKKCNNKKCAIVYWDYKVRKLNLLEEGIFIKTLEDAKIKKHNELNKTANKTHFVYIIKLKKNPKGYMYYRGMTGLHPYERYLNHIRGYKSNRLVKKFHSYMVKFEGLYSYDEAKKREHSIASDLNGPSYGN